MVSRKSGKKKVGEQKLGKEKMAKEKMAKAEILALKEEYTEKIKGLKEGIKYNNPIKLMEKAEEGTKLATALYFFKAIPNKVRLRLLSEIENITLSFIAKALRNAFKGINYQAIGLGRRYYDLLKEIDKIESTLKKKEPLKEEYKELLSREKELIGKIRKGQRSLLDDLSQCQEKIRQLRSQLQFFEDEEHNLRKLDKERAKIEEQIKRMGYEVDDIAKFLKLYEEYGTLMDRIGKMGRKERKSLEEIIEIYKKVAAIIEDIERIKKRR